MRAYLVTTGALFGLIAILHVWRAIAESNALARDPWFIFITALAVGLSMWAFRLLRLAPRAP